jgi:hypothetical protein
MTWPAGARLWATLLCAGGCATLSAQASLWEVAPRCESFAEWEARARAEGQADGRTVGARRDCARHTVAELPRRQLEHGGAQVQAELDALARALPAGELRALVAEVLGVGASGLRGMLELAIVSAQREQREAARAPAEESSLAQWHPTAGAVSATASCDGLGDEEALACLATVKAHAPEVDVSAAALTVARRRIAAMEALPAAMQAAALGRLFDGLSPLEATAALDQVLGSLEKVAPAVLAEARSAAGPERAATLAAPLGRLRSARAEVLHWQADAAAHQLAQAEAARARPLASALHRLVAAGFGGPAAAWPEPLAVDTSRSRCERLPKLPNVPRGLAARLAVRCTREARRPALPEGNEKTFEEERALKTERIEGDLSLACGGAVTHVRLSVQDVALETGAHELGEEPSGAATTLLLKVGAALAEAGQACARQHREAQETDCGSLTTLEPAQAEERFAEHALVSGGWAPCFRKWFVARVGVELPAVRSPAGAPGGGARLTGPARR